jgi:serine/threonine protein kinase
MGCTSGIFRYLAPERYENFCFPESDVFSFGMILYELLAGKPPFPDGLTLIDIVYRVARKLKVIPNEKNWKNEMSSIFNKQYFQLIRVEKSQSSAS